MGGVAEQYQVHEGVARLEKACLAGPFSAWYRVQAADRVPESIFIEACSHEDTGQAVRPLVSYWK